MEPEKKYIVFVDLDGTIINANSSELLARLGYRYGLIRKRDYFRGIYFSLLYRYNLIDPLKLMEKPVRWFAGVSEKTIMELSEVLLYEYLLDSIRWEIWSELKVHKENHAETVILSSAIAPVCRVVANHLEMNDVVCTNLEVVDGLYTGFPEGRFCFGDEKLIRITDYCKMKN